MLGRPPRPAAFGGTQRPRSTATTWLLFVSGIFGEPLFYLLSIGVGLGDLVGDVTVGGQSVDYATFVAPALLASSAMNGGIIRRAPSTCSARSSGPKTYDAVLATHLGPGDLALGELVWNVVRGAVYATSFMVFHVRFLGLSWVLRGPC